MARLIEYARSRNIGVPASVSTPYLNTIPPEQEAWFPGDERLEQRIRRIIRWNAAVMVVRANKAAEGNGRRLPPSSPPPRLMPWFWEYPTVSMGLGPINSIYQARFNRYLHHRRLDDTADSRGGCFPGDGGVD